MRLFLPFLFMALSSTVFATQFTWTNTQNNSLWDEPLNWIPIGLPGPQDSVNTGYADEIVIPAGYIANIKHLRILGELTIEVGAELNVDDGFLYVVGDVLNQGKITVTNSPEWGIFLSTQLASNNTFNNQGDIIIDGTDLGGLFVRFDQTFQNTEGGLLQIENTNLESIDLQGSFFNSGKVNTMSPGNGISIVMDHIGSMLQNLICGRLTFPDQIFLDEGIFVNYGFLETNYDGDHYVNPRVLNPINITNYKFIEDVNGAFANGDITNFGLWFEMYDGDQVSTGQPIDLFSGTLPLFSSLSDVYTDRMLTINAGSFDAATLTYTPNENANGLSNFFIEAHDEDADCRDTVKFTLSEPVLGTNYWLGGTGAWDNASKWSVGVPIDTDVVGIYGENDEVNILKDINAVAKKIIVNGSLKVFLDGSLSLNGEGEGSGIKIINGSMTNDGSVNVNNYAVGIDLQRSDLVNSNELQVLACYFGVNVQGNSSVESTFTNSGSYTCDTATAILVSFGDLINEVSGEFSFEADGDHTVISGDTLVNRGTITIGGLGKSSGSGIASVLANEVTGMVTLSDLEEGLDGGGINFGQLEMVRCGTGFRIDKEFTNKSGGSFSANRCDVAIYVASAEGINENGATISLVENGLGMDLAFGSSMFRNSGLINIQTILSEAITMRGTFVNRPLGQIIIQN